MLQVRQPRIVGLLCGWYAPRTLLLALLCGWTPRTLLLALLCGWTPRTLLLALLCGWTPQTLLLAFAAAAAARGAVWSTWGRSHGMRAHIDNFRHREGACGEHTIVGNQVCAMCDILGELCVVKSWRSILVVRAADLTSCGQTRTLFFWHQTRWGTQTQCMAISEPSKVPK